MKYLGLVLVLNIDFAQQFKLKYVGNLCFTNLIIYLFFLLKSWIYSTKERKSNCIVFTKVKVERRQICGKLMHQFNNKSGCPQPRPNGLGRVRKKVSHSFTFLERQICPFLSQKKEAPWVLKTQFLKLFRANSK